MISFPSGTVVFGSLLCVLSASARTDAPPVDAAGKPVCSANGGRLIYSQEDSPAVPKAQAGAAASFASAPLAPKAAAATAPSPEVTRAFWSYGIMGSNIGMAGMLPVSHDDGMEMIVSGTSPAWSFGANNFWYALKHDPQTGTYQQTHVHPPYAGLSGASAAIAAMTLADVTGDAAPELVVGLTDGRFFFYSTTTYEEVGSVRPVTSLTKFATADLNGDGSTELIILGESTLKVFNSSGQLLWALNGPGGNDLAIAQMDQDAALEIATTSGHVVDASTHTVQWTYPSGFGAHLRAADIDGDQRAELIAANAWYDIYAYDVDLKLPKWSLRTPQDIDSIEIANVDSDAAPELIYGDGQWGKLHVMTLNGVTPVEEWNAPNPEHGVQGIAVADTDGDGVAEILWSSGGTSSGKDRLEVLDAATRQPEWVSVHLDGPFLSPVIGDVTGDGVPELVTACSESDSGYSSGRILVFDAATLKLLGISQPIASNYSWTGLRDLKLRDVDGDQRLEIVVAADWLYDGLIEVYRFTDERAFERIWQNDVRPDGAPFSQVDLLDVDNDGNLEFVACNDTEHTGSAGNYIRIIDYAGKTQEWISPNLGGSFWSGLYASAIGDFDGDGHPEVVASDEGGGIAVVDLNSRAMEFVQSGNFRSVAFRPGSTGFLAGTSDGKVERFAPTGTGSYQVVETWNASAGPVTGLTPSGTESLWVNTEERISYWQNATSGPIWASDKLGANAVGPVALLKQDYGFDMFTGGSHAITGFQVATNDPSTVTMAVNGYLGEGSTSTATLIFSRNEIAADVPIEVQFRFNGTAVEEEDFSVQGATPLPEHVWKVMIPAGSRTASVTLTAIQDTVAEGTESLEAELLPGTGYFRGGELTAALDLEDDEAVVSVSASQPFLSEPIGMRTYPGKFVFYRTGNLSKALEVRFTLGGTATVGIDYAAIATRVIFPAGRETASVRIEPRADDLAEDSEEVALQIAASTGYQIAPDHGSATMTVYDREPTVSLTEAQAVRGGVALTLQRSDEETQPFTVTLAITSRYPDGDASIRFQQVGFKKGRGSAQCLFRPAKNATQTAEVSVELIEDGRYHPGNLTSLTFDLPPLR